MGRRNGRVLVLAIVIAAAGLRLGIPGPVAAADVLTSGKKLYSQKKEELIIRHFFQDRRNGFFVDVGCYHWKKHSTTYYLEKHLGCSGIGIDALPWPAAGYEKNRPDTKFFNYIVTDHSGTTESLFVYGPVSSTSKKWVEHFPFTKDKAIKEIRVPTVTLTEILERQGVLEIDFLSMDIEGGEVRALAGFDIERFTPDLICIETGEGTTGDVAACFDRHGYEQIDQYLKYDEVNRYYRPKAAAP